MFIRSRSAPTFIRIERLCKIPILHLVILKAAKTWNKNLSPKLASLIPVESTSAFHSSNLEVKLETSLFECFMVANLAY